eukprot:4043637-Amphidinium_carterae.1
MVTLARFPLALQCFSSFKSRRAKKDWMPSRWSLSHHLQDVDSDEARRGHSAGHLSKHSSIGSVTSSAFDGDLLGRRVSAFDGRTSRKSRHSPLAFDIPWGQGVIM